MTVGELKKMLEIQPDNFVVRLEAQTTEKRFFYLTKPVLTYGFTSVTLTGEIDLPKGGI